VGSFKHAARRELAEADVNGAMCVEFEAESTVIRTACLAVGGKLSTAAATYDLTPLIATRSALRSVDGKSFFAFFIRVTFLPRDAMHPRY